MSIKSFFQNLKEKLFAKEPHIRFKCIDGGHYLSTPVVEARRLIPEYIKDQVKKSKENKFARCPGMFDMSQTGYLIKAPCDIHIKANKQGVIIKLEMPSPLMNPAPMDYSLVEGIFKIENSVKPCVWKIPLPWSIFTKKGYSAYVLPATLHSTFLDKLSIYPGIVDYDEFHTINMIFSVLKECEFTIYGGEPILQVIPFKREDYNAVCGKATERETHKQFYGFFSRQKNFYRKMFHSKKLYKMKQI
jgi:hypothetical protein